jgi:hypothetical protein
MSYRTIREAQKTIWPAVQESLERHRAARRAIEADPRSASTAARVRANRPWNRVVAEETVWAVAKADLLNTPEDAAVIRAAREWARDIGPDLKSDPDDFEDADHKLYRAVQALVATPEIPDDIG